MGSITSLKCVLTQEHLDAICAKYFVPEEVHPQLPSSDATMHERPAGKVGMYTRFFDYANYRIPFSTFFVSVLTHFRIPFSQLSVFGSAKVSHFEMQDCEFACCYEDAAAEANVSVLTISASPVFHFRVLDLQEMDLNAFIRTADPRKVRIVERARAENERPIVTVAKHRTVTLLPTSVVCSSESCRLVGGQDDVEPTVPVTEPVGTEIPRPKRSKKKRVTRESERMPLPPPACPVVPLPSPTPLPCTPPLLQDSDINGRSRCSSSSLPLTLYYLPQFLLRKVCCSLRLMTEATLLQLLHPHVDIPADVSSYDVLQGRGGMEIRCGGRGYRLASSEEICFLIWTVTKGFEFNEWEEKRKWRSLAEEKDILLEAKDKEIVSGLKATENSLRVTGLESTIAEKDHELSDLGASSSSLKSQNQSLVNQVHELKISSTDLCEKLEMYEGSLKQLDEFQDNLIGPLRTRLAEIDADFTRCCMRFQESFHPHLLNVVAGRGWLLTHGMKLLVVKCLNSNEYMEALGHAFGRAIEKGMQEGLAAWIEHGQAGRCLTDLEAYIPSTEDDFNSAIRDLRDLNFPLLQELSNKKDATSVALDICRGRVE
ncbi:hypothetical protein Tco_1278239, partial [Tanacetum coccineum]